MQSGWTSAQQYLPLRRPVFWFCSAYGKLPPIVPYLGYTPSDDPFYLAIKFSAEMNKWAAGFSGLSALCVSTTAATARYGAEPWAGTAETVTLIP
jgi:hypothetical protein